MLAWFGELDLLTRIPAIGKQTVIAAVVASISVSLRVSRPTTPVPDANRLRK
jgi:hypothetical protein